MICLLQRVSEASVTIDGQRVANIEQGLMVLVGFQATDPTATTELQTLLGKMAERLLAYRIFSDEQDRMNLNVQQVGGAVLLVPQFTLAAETGKGLRPGFHSAAAPEVAQAAFSQFVECVSSRYSSVQQGQFGADMKVGLVNDGPVTFWLQL